MDSAKVQSALKELGQPAYRWDQVRKAVYDQAVASYDEISVLPAAVRAAMTEKAPILSLKERRVDVSSDGRAHKALLDLPMAEVDAQVLARQALEENGMVLSGPSPDDLLVEFIELPKSTHPFFVATQAHPEFKSRPNRPHPLFAAFVEAARQRADGRRPKLPIETEPVGSGVAALPR